MDSYLQSFFPPTFPHPAASIFLQSNQTRYLFIPVRFVKETSLQGDLNHVLLKAHEKDALAVQDLEAPDGLSLTFWQEFDFLEQAAA